MINNFEHLIIAKNGECESICVNGITHHFFGNNKNTLLHVEDRAPVETDLSAT
jgi:hypothetical protein